MANSPETVDRTMYDDSRQFARATYPYSESIQFFLLGAFAGYVVTPLCGAAEGGETMNNEFYFMFSFYR